MNLDLNNKRLIISRTDSIGDVLLTLPICGWIKQHFPSAKVVFLGRGYTKPVVTEYTHVDEFLDWDEIQTKDLNEQLDLFKADVIIHAFPNKQIAKLAKKANIPTRIGTSHRSFHLLTCNHRVNFTRKRSELHEAQLNHELLRPLGLGNIPTLNELSSQTDYLRRPDLEIPADLQDKLKGEKYVILHPKSQGSALEWPTEKYISLGKTLVESGIRVVYTGTESEGILFRKGIPQNALDTTGQLSLSQLMRLISEAEALVACSTGPLHLAGFYGVKAIGLFSSRRPIHPGRWKAIGKNVRIIVNNPECENCSAGKECDCLIHISVDEVLKELEPSSK